MKKRTRLPGSAGRARDGPEPDRVSLRGRSARGELRPRTGGRGGHPHPTRAGPPGAQPFSAEALGENRDHARPWSASSAALALPPRRDVPYDFNHRPGALVECAPRWAV